MKIFIFSAISLMSFLVLAQEKIYEWEKRELTKQKYVFFNHSSSYYDEGRFTEQSTPKLLEWARNHRVSTIMSIGDSMTEFKEKYHVTEPAPSLNTYYISPQSVDHVLFSISGAHELQLKNATSVIFAGGHEYLCLCEAIRDTIRGSNNSFLEVVLVAETIYVPNYSLLRVLNQAKDYPLGIAQNFKETMIGTDEEAFCPHQNYTNKEPLDKGEYEFSIAFHDRIIQLSNPRNDNRTFERKKVLFKLISINDL